MRDIEVAVSDATRLVDMVRIAEDGPPALEALAVYQQDGLPGPAGILQFSGPRLHP